MGQDYQASKLRFRKLDGLRGIFSVMIVFYHYITEFLPKYLADSFVIRESYVFVDFFFVLSGFVISHNYHDLSSGKEFAIYLKKRFIRLYPLLFYTVMVYFLFRLLALSLFPNSVDANDTIGVMLVKTMDSLLFTNSTVILGGENGGMNSPSWSISAEMISYVVFGVVMVLLAKSRKYRILVFAGIIVFSSVILVQKGGLFKMSDYGYLRSFVSFFMGFFVWRLQPQKIKIKYNLELVFPALILLLLFLLHNTKGSSITFYVEFLAPVTFAVFIFFLISSEGLLSSFLESKPIQHLGKISYSVYLNHFLFILVIPKAIFKLLMLENNQFNQILVLAMTLLIVAGYSHFTYKWVELKGGRLLKKRLL